MAPSGADKKPFWGCGRCGFETNWASKSRCHQCGAGAHAKARAKAEELAKGGKPKRDAAPKGGNGGSKGEASRATASKAAQQAKELEEARKHAAELKKQLEAERRKNNATPMAVDAADTGDDSELDKAVTLARERLKKAKEFPEEVRDLVQGGYEACLARLQVELAAAQAAKRASNPLSKQLEGAEAFKARMDKKAADAKSALDDCEAAVLEAIRQRDLQKATLAEAEAAAARATGEVAVLAAKFASERAAAPAAPEGASSTGGAQPPPGFVSVTFAEEKWQEREVAFNQQLEQLKAIIGTQQSAAAASADGASVASDVGNPEELDDDKWSKVDKGRRSALLRKQRDELASKLRSRLGGVTSVRSPFVKK